MTPKHNLHPNHIEAYPPLERGGDKIARTLQYAHERFGVDLNVSEAVERTLEVNGFTPLSPSLTPSVEEWIYERIVDQGYAGYNHGSFVEDATGNLGFAKVHYGPDNILSTVDEKGEIKETKVGGPRREAEILEALSSNGYETPQVLGYSPASPENTPEEDEKVYEMLVIEALLPEQGSVRERSEWTPSIARKAAQKIATFAQPTEAIALFKNESITLPVEDLIRSLPQKGDEYDEAIHQVLATYPYLDKPIVVHGDAWFNNIIATHDDGDVLFIDWELAGPGYRGQDAGRKLWDLTLTDDWRLGEYSESAEAFTDEWCAADYSRPSLEFGVVYESLRWISERMRDADNPATDEASRVSLIQEIDDVKAHTLKVLENIRQGS